MPVHVEETGHATIIIVDRIEKANSLDINHMSLLAETIRRECGRGKPLAITGADEKYFTAGLDLSLLAEENASPAEIASATRGLLETILSCNEPVVALVNGYAMGLGFELVIACDASIAVDHARLGLTAARHGIVPPLSPFLGDPTLYKLALSAQTITAAEARELGIVDGVAHTLEGLRGAMEELAKHYLSASHWALSKIKGARRRILLEALDTGIRVFEKSLSRRETRERVRRFLESRRERRGR